MNVTVSHSHHSAVRIRRRDGDGADLGGSGRERARAKPPGRAIVGAPDEIAASPQTPRVARIHRERSNEQSAITDSGGGVAERRAAIGAFNECNARERGEKSV